MTPLEQKNFFDENGYLLVESLFPETLLNDMRSVVAEFREKTKVLTRSNDVFDLGERHSETVPVVRRIKDPHLQHDVFKQASVYSPLIDVVENLLGDHGVRFDHGKLNFKPKGGGASVEWHQDWAFYPHTNDDMLAVGIMLEDCTLENGPLTVIPGSHKGEIYNHHHEGVFVGAMDVADIRDQVDKAVTITAPAGSVSIHHARTLHASRENMTDMERPLLLFSYMAVDSYPVADHYDWDEFNSRILRGDICYAPRQENVPIRIPFPAVPNRGSIYNDQAEVRGRSFM